MLHVICTRLRPSHLSARAGDSLWPVKRLQKSRIAPFSDGSKQLPALHTVEYSMYWTLAGRSSGENASLFQALPLYSCYDAPSPLTDVRSPCQFNCGAFFCQPSLTPTGVLSFHPYPVTSSFHSLLESFC